MIKIGSDPQRLKKGWLLRLSVWSFREPSATGSAMFAALRKPCFSTTKLPSENTHAKNNMMLAPTRRMVCSSAQRKQHCYFAAHSTSKGAIEGLAAQSCKGFNAVLNLVHLIYWLEADLQFTLPPRREQLESGFYRRFFCKTRPKMCASNTVGLKKKQWNKRLGLKTAEK